uniref:Regulatory protein zeste n=1 Tax=Nyssomyia neivai TaxID=330878 RepID=A0A1L8DC25_9DIPT
MLMIVKFMEENPEFARQRIRGTNYPPSCITMWNRLTAELNTLGPPARDWQSWRRVWCDFKSSIQKKLKQIEKFKSRGLDVPRNLALSENQDRINNLLSDGKYQPRRRTGRSANAKKPLPTYVVDDYEDDDENLSQDPLSMCEIEEMENYSEAENSGHGDDENNLNSLQKKVKLSVTMSSFEEKLLKLEQKRLHLEEQRLAIEKRKLEISELRYAKEEARLNTLKRMNVERIVPKSINPKKS